MKKKIALLLVCGLAMLLSFACQQALGSEGSDDPGSEEPGSEEPGSEEQEDYDFSSIERREIISVPGGTFVQLEADFSSNIVADSSYSHTVSSFSIGQYLVTYELWYAVREWATENDYTIPSVGREGSVTTGNGGNEGGAPTGAKYEPVALVEWYSVVVWLNAYSEMSGLTPVYYGEAELTEVLKSGSVLSVNNGVYANWAADGFRLPTEGEWQYAASYIDGETWLSSNHVSGNRNWPYNLSENKGEYAWYRDNSNIANDGYNGRKTHAVGLKLPNDLDIYDMSGNLSEWCWDRNGDYPDSPKTDYRGPDSGENRVNRGGSFGGSISVQVGFRVDNEPDIARVHVGFRVVR